VGRKAVPLFCIKMKDILDKEEVDVLLERSFFELWQHKYF
jgi:hypothetical protein